MPIVKKEKEKQSWHEIKQKANSFVLKVMPSFMPNDATRIEMEKETLKLAFGYCTYQNALNQCFQYPDKTEVRKCVNQMLYDGDAEDARSIRSQIGSVLYKKNNSEVKPIVSYMKPLYESFYRNFFADPLLAHTSEMLRRTYIMDAQTALCDSIKTDSAERLRKRHNKLLRREAEKWK